MRAAPLAAVLLVLATGCGPESTTATITAVGPLDPDEALLDLVTGEDGVVRAEHPAFGCVPLSDLVGITFELEADGNGRPRAGYGYPYQSESPGVLRSVAAGLAVGDTFPATYEVRHAFLELNGPTTSIRIPELDARMRAALPPPGTRTRIACPGSPNHYWQDDDLE